MIFKLNTVLNGSVAIFAGLLLMLATPPATAADSDKHAYIGVSVASVSSDLKAFRFTTGSGDQQITTIIDIDPELDRELALVAGYNFTRYFGLQLGVNFLRDSDLSGYSLSGQVYLPVGSSGNTKLFLDLGTHSWKVKDFGSGSSPRFGAGVMFGSSAFWNWQVGYYSWGSLELEFLEGFDKINSTFTRKELVDGGIPKTLDLDIKSLEIRTLYKF